MSTSESPDTIPLPSEPKPLRHELSPLSESHTLFGALSDVPSTPAEDTTSSGVEVLPSPALEGAEEEDSSEDGADLGLDIEAMGGALDSVDEGERRQLVERKGSEENPVKLDRPDWLPEDWAMEVKVRTQGSTAGTKDRYYVDPVSKHRFRSKREVFDFLETGRTGRYKPRPMIAETGANHTVTHRSNAVKSDPNYNPSHSAGSHKRNGLVFKQPGAPRFDFAKPPNKVRWVLTNASEGSWTPYIENDEVSESRKRSWASAMEFISNDDGWS